MQVPLNEYLSHRQSLRYQELFSGLDFAMADVPWLAIVGVDSAELGQRLQVDMLSRVPKLMLEENPEPYQDLRSLFPAYQQQAVPVLMPLFEIPESEYEIAAGQLLFHRDVIARLGIHLILLVNEGLFETIQTHNYDLLATSSFWEIFEDQKDKTRQDLDPAPIFSKEKLDYKERKAAYLRLAKRTTANPEARLFLGTQYMKLACRISKFEESLRIGEEIEAIARRILAKFELIEILKWQAKNYREIGHLTRSFALLQDALDIQQDIKQPAIEAELIGKLALVQHKMGELDQADTLFHTAISTYEQIGKTDLATIYRGYAGLIVLEKGNLDQALAAFKAALIIEEKRGYTQGIAVQYHHIGRVYHRKKNWDKALAYFRKSLWIDQQIGNRYGEAKNLSAIGAIYESTGEAEWALKYYTRANSLYAKSGSLSGRMEVASKMASAYRKLGKEKLAKPYLEEALHLSQETMNKKNEMRIQAALDLL